METIKKALLSKGIKPTYQRLKVLKYLLENKIHPTVDMIHEYILKDIPTISKTTVYNTLDTLIENRLIMSITVTGTEMRFDDNIIPHHHFLCERCGNITDLDIKCKYLGEKYINGNKINELCGYFKGVCGRCLKK